MVSEDNLPPRMPADLRQILDSDPRLEGLQNTPGEFLRPSRVLKPENPPQAGESEFVLLYLISDDPVGSGAWVNEPQGAYLSVRAGRGLGLKAIDAPPEFREKGARPKRRPDAFEYNTWLVVTTAFADVVRRFAPDGIDTLPVNWRFDDGSALEGTQFLDVTKVVDAYDYYRSELRVITDRGQRRFRGLNYPRATKPGADAGVHLCRDSFSRGDILVSRTLARAMAEAGLRGVRFQELATGHVVELDYAD